MFACKANIKVVQPIMNWAGRHGRESESFQKVCIHGFGVVSHRLNEANVMLVRVFMPELVCHCLKHLRLRLDQGDVDEAQAVVVMQT